MLPGVCLPLHRKKKKENGKKRLSTRLMCWQTVTLRLNPWFFFLEAKERGDFSAQQLLALVTVNWPLSEAVKVFYGPLFVPGLCQGSHLWGEQSYWWPRLLHFVSPQNSATVNHRPTTTGGDISLFPWLTLRSPPPFSVLLRDKATAPVVIVGLGVPYFLFMSEDFVSGTVPLRRYLDDKRLVPFTTY